MNGHPISMAAGIMPEATPLQLVEAAARAGFDYGGMWMEPASWTSETTRAVRHRLDDSGLRLLDIEVVWIKPGPLDPDHLRIVDVGAELGARNVLCVSSDPDEGATIAKIAAIADHGAKLGITVNLEFGLFTRVRTIDAARRIVDRSGSSNLAILIDALHLTRSGGTAEQVAALPPERISYVQLCDAPMPGAQPDDDDAILLEAIDGRMPLGTGGLPLRELLNVLPPDLPIGIEERSLSLRSQWPDLNERAKACYITSRRYLDAQLSDSF